MVVFDNHEYLTEEEKRLKEDKKRIKYWKKWGPYISERQWATGEQERPCTYGRDLQLTSQLQSGRTTALMAMLGAVGYPTP